MFALTKMNIYSKPDFEEYFNEKLKIVHNVIKNYFFHAYW